MKTLQKFLFNGPSYCRKSASYLSEKTGLKVKTVKNQMTKGWFKSFRKTYDLSTKN